MCDLHADRGTSSAVVERLAAVRCARADDRGDHASDVSQLAGLGCDFLPVVGDFAPVVGFDADDVWELAFRRWEHRDDVCEPAADMKFLADDRGKCVPRRWEHALRGWELPSSRCELPPRV